MSSSSFSNQNVTYDSDLIFPLPVQFDLNIIQPIDPLNISFSQEKCVKHVKTPSTKSPNGNSSTQKKESDDLIFTSNWQLKVGRQLQNEFKQNYMSVVRNPLQLFGTTSKSHSKRPIHELDFGPLSTQILTNQNTKKSLQVSHLLQNAQNRDKNYKSIIQQKKYYSLKKTNSDFHRLFPVQSINHRISFTDKKNKQKLINKQNYEYLSKLARPDQYMNQKYIKLNQIIRNSQTFDNKIRTRLERYDTNIIDLRMRNLERLKQGLKHQVVPVGKYGSHINEIQRLDGLLSRVNSQLSKTQKLQ